MLLNRCQSYLLIQSRPPLVHSTAASVVIWAEWRIFHSHISDVFRSGCSFFVCGLICCYRSASLLTRELNYSPICALVRLTRFGLSWSEGNLFLYTLFSLITSIISASLVRYELTRFNLYPIGDIFFTLPLFLLGSSGSGGNGCEHFLSMIGIGLVLRLGSCADTLSVNVVALVFDIRINFYPFRS